MLRRNVAPQLAMDQDQCDLNTNDDMSSEGPPLQHQEPMLTVAETENVRARKKYSRDDDIGAAESPDGVETASGSHNDQQCQQQTKEVFAEVRAGAATDSRKEDMQLLQWIDMPKHLQFNPYILTGYRPLSDAWGCVNSITYMHNETINIVSHAVPILYILLTVPQILPWEQAELSFLAWCHIAGILCPWVGSFLYHLFMNLRRGPRTYYFLLQVDMLGIWVSQSFGAMPMIFATTYCLPHHIKTFLITCYCLFSIWGLYKALIAWSPWERRLCFLLPFVMRILVWFLRLSKLGGGDPSALIHVILQDVVSITGGAIGALHIPEKWFPGAVDMYLNSHNIMHVMVVAAVYSMHTATMRDLAWMSRVKCITA